MTKPKDDLEAVRALADTLEGFNNEERERIFRWAREKLGMPGAAVFQPPAPAPPASAGPQAAPPTPVPPAGGGPRDIRSFIQEKDPKNDSQMAAVVAYYHHFVAPEADRRESITSADLIEACRQADRARPTRPRDVSIVLRNYRNYIHPSKELSHGVKIEAEDSEMFWVVFQSLAGQIANSV